MKRAGYILLMLLFSFEVSSQKDSLSAKDPEDAIFQPVETPPVYPGGPKAWRNFIDSNLRYPALAKEKFKPGAVHQFKVVFVVGKDSAIQSVTVTDTSGLGFADEIKRVIYAGGKWTPATQNGRIINAFQRQEFIFRRPDQ